MRKIIGSNTQKSKRKRKEPQIKAGSSESSSAKRLEKWYEKSCCLHKSQEISLKFEEKFRGKLIFFSAEHLYSYSLLLIHERMSNIYIVLSYDINVICIRQ